MDGPAIARFLVDEDARGLEMTEALFAARPDVPVTFLPAGETPATALERLGAPANKTVYHLTRPRGRHFKKCPGITEHYVCCNLHVLDQAENCPLACSYCFLQGYLTESISTLYVDHEPLFEGIRRKTAAQPRRLFRVGTGELSDSLALDPLTGFSRRIVPFFAALPNAVLELKTKSDRVEDLLGLDPRGRTVVAWSVNPPAVNDREEPGCAPVTDRLRAARRVVEAGYRVGFHFDPMLHYPGCEEDYAALVRDVFDAAPAERIAWISVGSVRFDPAMRDRVMERYPRSKVMLGEIVRGYDGKARYLKPIRHRLYGAFFDALRRHARGEVFAYFCMENAETWEKFTGRAPRDNPHLDYLFAESLNRKFPGLLPSPPREEDYRETAPLDLVPAPPSTPSPAGGRGPVGGRGP